MIRIEGLVKKFGERTVLHDLHIHIGAGEIFGLLGPNGAGKTTVVRILTMLARPTAGKVLINGWRAPEDAMHIKSLIGVVPQHFNLDSDLTARENLELHGRLHHMKRAERQERIDELLDYVDLSVRAHDTIRNFSGGMKRRLMIARALLHRPRILFLDEPTVGLDPQVRRKLWALIKKMNNAGLTVLLTTHYIEEAENLCRRVAIMDQGKLMAINSPAALCRQYGEFVVEWDDGEGRQAQFFAGRTEAAQFAGTLSGDTILRRSNLEDVFVRLIGRKVMD